MALVADELDKTGLWKSLGVDAAGSIEEQYVAEEVASCAQRLKEIEGERGRAVDAFAASLTHA